jgi:hypothetical protein
LAGPLGRGIAKTNNSKRVVGDLRDQIGARKASKIVMLTFRTLQLSRSNLLDIGHSTRTRPIANPASKYTQPRCSVKYAIEFVK